MCMNLTPLISISILKLFSKVFTALFVSILFKFIQDYLRVCLCVYKDTVYKPNKTQLPVMVYILSLFSALSPTGTQ